MPRRFQPPIEAVDQEDGTTSWDLHLPVDHRVVVVQLLGELRALLTDDAPSPLLTRLFPPVYPDDEDKEAEYQRLMRDDLVTSRVAQLDLVSTLLQPDGPEQLDEAQVVALMQSLNAVRVVLGTMLDVGEDDDEEPPPDADEQTSQAHELYAFLSWLLEWTVRSMSG